MDGKLTILLVEDNPGDAALIKEMLRDVAGSPFTLYWADCLSKGLVRIAGGDINVVLLDLTLPDSSGLDTFITVREAAPDLPIIVLSGNEDETLALTAVREGAEDYLVKGKISGQALTRCLRYTIERHARQKRLLDSSQAKPQPRTRVLGFLGAKGGIGTTTVVVNVAAALAERKYDVIAVELRGSYGTLSHHFGNQSPAENLSALLETPPGEINEMELNARTGRHSHGFRVLLGPQTAQESKTLPGELAKAIVDTLARMAQYVILDLPSEPSEATREAVRLCDFVGLVVDREPSSVACGKVMLEQLRMWKTDALIGGVVVHRTSLACPLDLNEITSQLGLGIIGLIPPAADACVMAQKAGIPAVVSYEDTLVGDSFRELALKLSDEPIVIKKTA